MSDEIEFHVELLGKVWLFRGIHSISDLIDAMDRIATDSMSNRRYLFGPDQPPNPPQTADETTPSAEF